MWIVNYVDLDYDCLEDSGCYVFEEEIKAKECYEKLKEVFYNVEYYEVEVNKQPNIYEYYRLIYHPIGGKKEISKIKSLKEIELSRSKPYINKYGGFYNSAVGIFSTKEEIDEFIIEFKDFIKGKEFVKYNSHYIDKSYFVDGKIEVPEENAVYILDTEVRKEYLKKPDGNNPFECKVAASGIKDSVFPFL